MTQYIEKVNEKIETITHTKYFTEFVDAFKEIRNWAISEERKEEEKLAQYEIEICSLYVKKFTLITRGKEQRFVAQHGFVDGTEWPDIESLLKNSMNIMNKGYLKLVMYSCVLDIQTFYLNIIKKYP